MRGADGALSGLTGCLFLLGRSLVDVFLPRGCAGCDRPDQVLCPSCSLLFAQARAIPAPYLELGTAHVCADYAGPVRRTLLSWKDHGDIEVTRPLAAAISSLARTILPLILSAYSSLPARGRLLVVPAPSSPSSLRRRGRSHLAPLAAALAETLTGSGLPAEPAPCLALRGVRKKAVQAGGRAARSHRLTGHVECVGRPCPEGRAVILLDDIITTGATLRQCASVLNETGAHPLTALALAGAGPPQRA